MRTIKSSFILGGAFGAWLLVVVLGSLALWRYKCISAHEPVAPLAWPAMSRLYRADAVPTLVLFAHPRCACTRASLGELARLLASVQGRVSTLVVFFRPQGSAASWARGDLWSAAAAIPGVSVYDDEGGREAALFHGETSGHLALYDVTGSQIFDGGITASRGHMGDNVGLDSLLALLSGLAPAQRHSAVFGCPIQARKNISTCMEKPCEPQSL